MSGHILELNENVTRKTVVYKNRYGLDITGELYLKKSIDLNKKTGVVKRYKKQIKLGNELKELTNGRELYNNYLIQDRCHKKVSYKIQIRNV